jgi:hypothetical protein
MTQFQLEMLREHIANAICDHLEPIFTPDMMLTLIARHPTNKNCFIVISADNDRQAVAELTGCAEDVLIARRKLELWDDLVEILTTAVNTTVKVVDEFPGWEEDDELMGKARRLLARAKEVDAQKTPQTRPAAPNPNRPRSQPRPPGD